MSKITGYELSRKFWDWSFSNPEKVKPIHSAIYFFAIEHCNRLGWKEKFGFPSQMVMEAIGVKNWRTYSSGLNDLVDFGFIKMLEISKNQYSSNIIAIVNFTKAPTKALDKALQKHSTKHSQSTVSINKQYNNEQENNITIDNNVFFETALTSQQWIESVCMSQGLRQEVLNKKLEDFKNHLISIGEQKKSVKAFKTHFINWVSKNKSIIKSKHTAHQSNAF